MAMLAIGMAPSESPAKMIETFRVPSEVYWAAYRASGAKLCDRDIRELQERLFDERYGKRVSSLLDAMEAEQQRGSHEPDDLIVTSDCFGITHDRDEAKRLSEALDAFEAELNGLERKYGIGDQ